MILLNTEKKYSQKIFIADLTSLSWPYVISARFTIMSNQCISVHMHSTIKNITITYCGYLRHAWQRPRHACNVLGRPQHALQHPRHAWQCLWPTSACFATSQTSHIEQKSPHFLPYKHAQDVASMPRTLLSMPQVPTHTFMNSNYTHCLLFFILISFGFTYEFTLSFFLFIEFLIIYLYIRPFVFYTLLTNLEQKLKKKKKKLK